MKEVFFKLHSLEGMALLMLVVHFLVLNHSAQYSWSVNSSKQQVSTKRKEHFWNYSSGTKVSKATHTKQHSNLYQQSLQELSHIYCASTRFFLAYQDLELMVLILLPPPQLPLSLFECLLFWCESLRTHNIMSWERKAKKK